MSNDTLINTITIPKRVMDRFGREQDVKGYDEFGQEIYQNQ